MELFTLLLVNLLFSFGSSVDLTCPKSPVDNGTGEFPTGGLAMFPSGYKCRVDLSLKKENLLKQSREFQFQISAAPAKTSRVSIEVNSAEAYFHLSWQFVPISNFTSVTQRIGEPGQLNLNANRFYCYTSSKDNVAFHIAKLNQNFRNWEQDPNVAYIYAYDGDDLNATFLGDLSTLSGRNETLKSSGRSLTLVNFYGFPTNSFGLANDFSAISGYHSYNFTLRSKESAAITFFSVDSDQLVADFTLSKRDVEGLATVLPQTPSHGNPPVLTYRSTEINTDDGDDYFPQLIPSNLVTWTVCKCSATYMVTVEDIGPNNSTEIFSGRNGFILSPSLWKTQKQNSVNVTIVSSADSTYTISYRVESLITTEPGEGLTVRVASPNADPNVTEFHQNTTKSGETAVDGTQMVTALSSDSSFVLSFRTKAKLPDDSATTANSQLTTPNGSSSNVVSCLLVFLVLLNFVFVWHF